MERELRKSGQSVSSLRRNIEQGIQRIDKKIVLLTRLKDEAIEKLLKQKEECREKEILGEIDEELARLQAKHSSIVARQTRIHEAKKDYNVLEQDLAAINNELMAIQERHEAVMHQLNEKKDYLQERLGSIETLDMMKVKIEEDVAKEREDYESELERLRREREELLRRTDLSPSAMELALREIDEQIERLEGTHVSKMSQLRQASSDIQSEFSKVLSPAEDQQMLADALEERGLSLTESGRIISASGRIMSVQEAQEGGLLDGIEEEVSDVDERDKLTRLLEERGLTMTPSGRIRLDSGEVYTLDEAQKLGLLRGLESEIMRFKGLALTASGRILTKDGRVLTRSEAELLGLLDGINLDELYAPASESESETMSSVATTMSGMSSADVHYLKTVLGRPLALALAEITAKQPRDPVHYLGHWLYKYRYNQEVDEERKRELEELAQERDRVAKDALRRQAEADARSVLLEMLSRMDVGADRAGAQADLHGIDEASAAVDDAEEAELASEARDTLGVYDGPTRGQQLT